MNFSRFYAIFRLLPKYGDDEDLKVRLVLDASGGRTTSLRELTAEEYRLLCESIDRRVEQREILRRKRSAVLRQMTDMGIDTRDWAKVDSLCQQPRIAGKPFRYLDIAELGDLSRKLHAIARKRPRGGAPTPKVEVFLLDPEATLNRFPS